MTKKNKCPKCNRFVRPFVFWGFCRNCDDMIKVIFAFDNRVYTAIRKDKSIKYQWKIKEVKA